MLFLFITIAMHLHEQEYEKACQTSLLIIIIPQFANVATDFSSFLFTFG